MSRCRALLFFCIPTMAAVACDARKAPSADATSSALPAPATSTSKWTVTTTGIGALHAGMTLAEASAAYGAALVPRDSASCTYVTLPDHPTGVAVMVVDGRIARVDVREPGITTDRGAQVGDSETTVQSMYGASLHVTPHKYTDGHYFTVTPTAPADSADRLVFETDGQRVTAYRSGRQPMVEWVEGCS